MNREELLEKYAEPIPVLNYGHVALIDVMGDDYRIEAAARLSYQKGTRKVSETRGLLRYLMRHKHWTPFEKCVIEIDMKMPIFIARQFVRHRTQSINELSGRYSELPAEFYVPDNEHMAYQATDNKQGRGAPFSVEEAEQLRAQMQDEGEDAFDTYKQFLGADMAKELARMGLPLSTYTQWNTTMNLRNLFGFLSLRLDPHAQYEARVYAEAIYKIVKDWVPLATEAFENYDLYAVTFSRQEMIGMRKALARYAENEVLGAEAHGIEGPTEMNFILGLVPDLPKREQEEFIKKLGLA